MREKVAIVDPASYTLPYDYYFVREIAKCYEVDFYCSHTPYNWIYAEKLGQQHGVRIVPFFISSVSRVRGFLNYVRLLTLLILRRRRYRAIHFQWQILKGKVAWLELLAFRLLGKKLTFTIHNPVPHGFTGGKTFWLFRQIRKIARKLILVSQYSFERFENDYGRTERADVIQHGLMPLEPEEPMPDTREDIPERTVVFWGNVKPYKGVDLLLHMVESGAFNDTRFEVYGKWDPGMDELRNRLTDAGVQVENRFLDIEEVRYLLNRPVLFIFPYLDVTQSGVLYTLLFYCSCFITADTGDNARFARQHGLEKLIFDRGDLQSIRDAMDYSMQNRKRIRETLVQARDSYKWEHTMKNPCETYRLVN